MNDENQENEALKDPVILTIPASITVPGFAFLVALNPDWCFASQEREVHHRASRRDSSVVPCERPPLTKSLSNSSERNGTLGAGV
jgi:hypothetical protein